MDNVKIAERLVKLRANKKREEVAKAIGVSLSAVAMYESGQRVPKDEIKMRIARYFGRSVESIFFT